MTDELGREELLKWLKEEVDRYAFLQITHPYLAQKPTKKDKQAYEQIKTLIQEPGVTEEFIDEKAVRFLLSFPGTYTRQHQSQHQNQLKYIIDFIRELIKEIHGRK